MTMSRSEFDALCTRMENSEYACALFFVNGQVKRVGIGTVSFVMAMDAGYAAAAAFDVVMPPVYVSSPVAEAYHGFGNLRRLVRGC